MLVDLRDWARFLAECARPALAGSPLDPRLVTTPEERAAYVRTFSDEVGHRRAADAAMLARLLGVDPGPPPPPTPPREETSTDVALWWGLHREDASLLARVERGEGPLALDARPGGIEIWTEAELSALHALWHHAARDPRLLTRCRSAAEWLLANMQPDNATGHPWATHVFAWLGVEHRNDEARLYAETLAHNALVGRAMPERFAACVLLDSALSLGAYAG